MLVDLPCLLGLVGIMAARRKLVHYEMHIVAERDKGAPESSAPIADDYDCAFDLHALGCARCRQCNYCAKGVRFTLAAIELRRCSAEAIAAIRQRENESQKAKQSSQGILAAHGNP